MSKDRQKEKAGKIQKREVLKTIKILSKKLKKKDWKIGGGGGERGKKN